MPDFEKLGVFYLGRKYDLEAKAAKPDLLLYDSRDLLTHAVCIGMTGSGKTGLCLGLLEEAAIDGIPVIAIDPKGDLGNLLLTFPSLSAGDFLPWVNADDAERQGVSLDDLAASQAALWGKGLAEWDEDGKRIARLKDSADFTIYTPGAGFGVPVSALSSFAAPPQDLAMDNDLWLEKINGLVSCILTLMGIEADPIKSREHILLATIFDTAWRQGQDLNLSSLIQQIQKPPFNRIGAFDLESFYSAKQRFELAMSLNNILAAPSFAAWMQGEPLDIDRILYNRKGKPCVSIFSIAHLPDAERMFFVSLLLNQILSWMRRQSGTTSLRAILYMDEIFGFFPPVAAPPSKSPLLMLIKQARAFGLGVVLASQNPVDLDYKGLANCGTWFLGRLQTERDKARVLEGLEGAGQNQAFDKKQMDSLLSSLGNRVFLMNDVHADGPELFQTRWTLSYLRGPLSRDQIKKLMEDKKQRTAQESKESEDLVCPPRAGAAPLPSETQAKQGETNNPIIAPDITQFYIPVGKSAAGKKIIYRARLYAAAQLRFIDGKLKIDFSQEKYYMNRIGDGAVALNWAEAQETNFALKDLESLPCENASFAELSPEACRAASYKTWTKDFINWLSASAKLKIYVSKQTGIASLPGEAERDFRIRLGQSGKEKRDLALDEMRKKYAPKLSALEEKIRKQEQKVEVEQSDSQRAQLNTAVEVGATVLGALMGRKALGSRTISRAQAASRAAGRIGKEEQELQHAQETLSTFKSELAELEAQFKSEMKALAARIDPQNETLDVVEIAAKKANIQLKVLGLVFVPYWLDEAGKFNQAWK